MLGVVALGLVGAAYTLWYEDLVLETTIETGTLDADWSFHAWEDGGTDGEGTFASNSGSGAGKPIVRIVNPAVANPSGGVGLGTTGRGNNIALWTNSNFDLYGGKPQTQCSGVLDSTNLVLADANDDAETNELSLYAGGLFPYAGCEWQINIENNGTVPFHIAIQGFVVEECTAFSGSNCTAWGPISGGNPFTRAILGAERNPNSVNDDRVACWNVLGADWNLGSDIPGIINETNPTATGNVGSPVQLHGGEQILCNLALVLDQREEAEGKTYRYTISYRTFQWNETPDDSILNSNPN